MDDNRCNPTGDPMEAGHRGERDCNRPARKYLVGIAAVYLERSPGRQISERLNKEHEPLRRQLKAGKQRFVEDEHRREFRVSRQRWIGVTE